MKLKSAEYRGTQDKAPLHKNLFVHFKQFRCLMLLVKRLNMFFIPFCLENSTIRCKRCYVLRSLALKCFFIIFNVESHLAILLCSQKMNVMQQLRRILSEATLTHWRQKRNVYFSWRNIIVYFAPKMYIKRNAGIQNLVCKEIKMAAAQISDNCVHRDI